MDLTGNVYGQWTIIEDKNELLNGGSGLTCQCTCGTVKKLAKSPFLHGYNSTKCWNCNKRLVRPRGVTTKK